jgi:hypothetical protein
VWVPDVFHLFLIVTMNYPATSYGVSKPSPPKSPAGGLYKRGSPYRIRPAQLEGRKAADGGGEKKPRASLLGIRPIEIKNPFLPDEVCVPRLSQKNFWRANYKTGEYNCRN